MKDTHHSLKSPGEMKGASLGADIGTADRVFQPPHYTQFKGMEPFTFFFLNNVPFPEASACKYILRWKMKNGVEDLQKARRIIDMMIDMETNRSDYTPKKSCL